MADRINSDKELHVYQNAMYAAMDIFELTKKFPSEEKYSLVDQIRRSSRSVCTYLAEGWRKRRYRAAFIAKLSDSETETCETHVWIKFSVICQSLDPITAEKLDGKYNHIISQYITMIDDPDKWFINPK